MSYVPPRSPFGLLQEDLFPNEWFILVSCVMLNCTSRKQVEKVLPEFIRLWPTPRALARADRDEISRVLAPLGFRNRRTVRLQKLARAYLRDDWEDARELPGVGPYAGAAWDMFCRGNIPDECPRDGALRLYWRWMKERSKWS